MYKQNSILIWIHLRVSLHWDLNELKCLFKMVKKSKSLPSAQKRGKMNREIEHLKG